MKQSKLFSVIGLLFAPAFAFGACSTNNLTRCLDSACAINIGANAAARCQYCGSSAAGTPTTAGVMKNITAGSAAKYTLSDKELKKAPTNPGERYIWAAEQCLKKIGGCTAEDVSDTYDSLIEQSCKAAGISADMANLTKKAKQTKNSKSCSADINKCVLNEKHCGNNYTNCESDADFDKYFSQCALASQGCDEFLSEIRPDLSNTRKGIFANAAKQLQGLVQWYQTKRANSLAQKTNNCKNGSAKQTCINAACASYMPNKCATGYENERSMAEQLCGFYDTACERLK